MTLGRPIPSMVLLLFAQLAWAPSVASASESPETEDDRAAAREEAPAEPGATTPSSERGSGPAFAWLDASRLPPMVEKLDWTWLSAGVTAFLGTAAVLTAVDARSMEKDLAARLEESSTRPQSGSEIVELAARTRRRAVMANMLWGATGVGLLTTCGLFYLEARPVLGQGAGLVLVWRLP